MRLIRILLFVFILIISHSILNAQSYKVVGGSTLVGAGNGAIVGLGIMGLSNSSDFTALRVGAGVGTLYGLGIGFYDLTQMDSNLGFYQVEGIFNSAEYSSLIVLYDTFYGGATGAVVGVAFSLIAGSTLGKGVQYGASAGVIGGFAFGLVDAFHFGTRTGTFDPNYASNRQASGLLNLSGSERFNLGLIHPVLFSAPEYNTSAGTMGIQTSHALQIAHLKVFF